MLGPCEEFLGFEKDVKSVKVAVVDLMVDVMIRIGIVMIDACVSCICSDVSYFVREMRRGDISTLLKLTTLRANINFQYLHYQLYIFFKSLI